MRQVKIITAEEAAKLVKNGDTITTSGFVASAIPEALNKAVEKRFLETGEPNNLTYVYCGSQGNKDGRGAEHYAHEGMLKRYIAGHWATVPALAKMALENKMEAYNQRYCCTQTWYIYKSWSGYIHRPQKRRR